MTMQVGMLGSDGVLLASDTKWMHDNGVRGSDNRTKFRVSVEMGIAIACARSMETATHIAEAILAELKEEEFPSPRLAIQRIAKETLVSAERKQIECLIALTRPKAKLFHLEVEISQYQVDPYCYPILSGATIAGDQTNAAKFWIERYYRPVSIRELAPLAAQAICDASELNNAAIGGLDILLCENNSIQRLSEDSIVALQAKTRELANTFAEMVLSNTQQFTYAPDVIG